MAHSSKKRTRGPWAAALLGSALLAALAHTPAGAAQKVACVGDSITQGTGSSRPANNYPSLLAKLLGPQYTVGNFGESGSTLLKHGDSPFRQRGGYAASAAFAPNIVVIMLGTNDSKPQNWSHKAEFAADYAALLDYYAALPTHPRLYVCLPPPVTHEKYGINEKAVEEELPLIRQVAAQKGATVINVHDEMPADPADFIDGVHPNDTGYVLLASAIYEGLTHAPIILPIGGASFYDPIQVTIKPPTPNAPVRYTTNGAAPTAASPLYRGQFTIKNTATITAQAFGPQGPLGQTSAATFTRLAPLPAQTPANTAPGLAYSYYEGTFQSVTDLKGPPAATGDAPDFALTPRKRDTNFGLTFTGYVDAPKTGLYTFTIASDDGSALSIDGKTVIDNDGLHGPDPMTGQIALKAGKHALTVSYFQGGGDSSLRVTWQGPNLPTQDIPASALSHVK